MLLDVNFFALTFRHGKTGPGFIECFRQAIDEDEEIHYVRVRTKSTGYGTELRDSGPDQSGIIYGECHGSSPPHIHRSDNLLFLLYAPEATVEMRRTGKLALQWDFEWEGERYRWTGTNPLGGRSDLECRLLVDGDPDIVIAQFGPKSNKTTRTLGALTFLDHNIQRAPLEDKKGLEIILVFGVMFFLDAWYDASLDSDSLDFVTGPVSDGTVLQEEMRHLEVEEEKRLKKSGLDRMPNEVIILEKHAVADVVRKSRKRLLDPDNLYITLSAQHPDQIKKLVLAIPEIQSAWSSLYATWRLEMEQWQRELDQEEKIRPNTRRTKATVPDHIGDRLEQLIIYPEGAGAGTPDPLKASQSAIFKEEQYHLDQKTKKRSPFLFSSRPKTPTYQWQGPSSLTVHLATMAIPTLGSSSK